MSRTALSPLMSMRAGTAIGCVLYCETEPALEADHSMLGDEAARHCWVSHPTRAVGVFHVRAPALPAQRFLGGGSEGGLRPPSEHYTAWASTALRNPS